MNQRNKENQKISAGISVRSQKLKELNEKIQALNKTSQTQVRNRKRKNILKKETPISSQGIRNCSQSKIVVERFLVQKAQNQDNANASQHQQNCSYLSSTNAANNLVGNIQNNGNDKHNIYVEEQSIQKCCNSQEGIVSFYKIKQDKESASLQIVIDKLLGAGIRVGSLCRCSPQLDFTDVNYTQNCCQNCELYNQPSRHRKLLEALLTV
eukprot:TRINITY_DN8368_c0_g1_i5.p2 TRINITY_DN8368_c0_g1~~TRINITY_DN8368_c0_g1_i5.p2  ORF type:complete len:210 (-),score=-0.48 TRINITY_DN8368_c0_g1_i5:168-797(-)